MWCGRTDGGCISDHFGLSSLRVRVWAEAKGEAMRVFNPRTDAAVVKRALVAGRYGRSLWLPKLAARESWPRGSSSAVQASLDRSELCAPGPLDRRHRAMGKLVLAGSDTGTAAHCPGPLRPTHARNELGASRRPGRYRSDGVGSSHGLPRRCNFPSAPGDRRLQTPAPEIHTNVRRRLRERAAAAG